jgi:predicted ATPase/class 3 adenylate cyclase
MPDLPSGTITFLFTDIEGSTRLWEEQPDTMRLALARHDALLRTTIETNGGMVFKTIGDAFCAAFSRAPQALEAALSAQQSLHQMTAGGASDLELKVRMALHIGTADQRDGDYFGQPLNRVARLLAAGHGGQVLLSRTAYDLIRDFLPSNSTLKDLGEYRLRDLTRPEQVYQLLHPDLPAEFPPLRSLDNPAMPNNLPRQVTSFVGREKELREIKEGMRSAPLLTLTGSGGCGKTRLSLQAAADVLEDYPDGVWLVELAPLTDPSLVPLTVADAVGIREALGEPITRTLLNALKERRMLLVLDNCEHLLDAAARLAETLLRSCSKLKIVVSSREALGIAGETAYRVPSLALPPLPSFSSSSDMGGPYTGTTPLDRELTPESLSQYEAVRLFLERAQAMKADFAITRQNAAALASVCHRLEGIPLAIELAAARIRSMTIEELERRLDDRFRILTGGSRTALPRQQTLRAMIDWSYNLLDESQKMLLVRLSVFAGGWTLEAAEAVASTEDEGNREAIWIQMKAESQIYPSEILDLLTSLVDKSLVLAEEQGETTRYRLLDVLREYAAEKRNASAESAVIRRRHAEYYLRSALQRLRQLRTPEEAAALRAFGSDVDNVRAAMDWSIREGPSALRVELALALGIFLQRRGFRQDATLRIEIGLEQARQTGLEETALYAELLRERAGLHLDLLEPEAARQRAQEARSRFAQLGDRKAEAYANNLLGLSARMAKDYSEARSCLIRASEQFAQVEDEVGIAIVECNLGLVAYEQGTEYERDAAAHWQESLRLSRNHGDRRGSAATLINLGALAQAQDDLVIAWQRYAEALQLERELGNVLGMGRALSNLGEVASQQGDLPRAFRLYVAAERLLDEIGSPQKSHTSDLLQQTASALGRSPEEIAALRLSLRDGALDDLLS